MIDSILSTLAAARAQRDRAQVRLEAAGTALERGRTIAAETTAVAERFSDAEQAATDEYARQLEESAVTGVPANPYLTVAPDAVAQHRAQAEARAAIQALERLTTAHTEAQAALAAADEHLLEIHRRAIASRVDQLTAELLAVRSRELEIVGLISALGHGELGRVQLSAEATAAVSYPPSRPTADNLIGSGAVADLNSPICGRLDVFERARIYWRDFVAQLEERAATQPTSQQQAA